MATSVALGMLSRENRCYAMVFVSGMMIYTVHLTNMSLLLHTHARTHSRKV